jgi:peptidoglycan hydrolase-like protein with peptidoglycan-binding domain
MYNHGYYSGPIDGIIGPDIQAAIADYQTDYGLPVTAAIDDRPLNHWDWFSKIVSQQSWNNPAPRG